MGASRPFIGYQIHGVVVASVNRLPKGGDTLNRILLFLTLFAFSICFLLFYALANTPASPPILATNTVDAATNRQYRDVDFTGDLENRFEEFENRIATLEGHVVDLEMQLYDLEYYVEERQQSFLDELQENRAWIDDIDYRVSELETLIE